MSLVGLQQGAQWRAGSGQFGQHLGAMGNIGETDKPDIGPQILPALAVFVEIKVLNATAQLRQPGQAEAGFEPADAPYLIEHLGYFRHADVRV